MDARHFREKAEVLLRLADGLSLNDLGRFQLMALAEDLRKRAREVDAQTTLQPQQSQSEGGIPGRAVQMGEPADIGNVPLLQIQTNSNGG